MSTFIEYLCSKKGALGRKPSAEYLCKYKYWSEHMYNPFVCDIMLCEHPERTNFLADACVIPLVVGMSYLIPAPTNLLNVTWLPHIY